MPAPAGVPAAFQRAGNGFDDRRAFGERRRGVIEIYVLIVPQDGEIISDTLYGGL